MFTLNWATQRDFLLCVCQTARNLGFPVLYGDGSRPIVLQTASITLPKAVMVMYTGKKITVESVERLRLAFPSVIVYNICNNIFIHFFCPYVRSAYAKWQGINIFFGKVCGRIPPFPGLSRVSSTSLRSSTGLEPVTFPLETYLWIV